LLVDLGVSEADRIGIGGHSYGAFMTANMLAHSDLFAAGIARSGAYNRSLTPFGFQSEQRTFWEAPELYFEMSMEEVTLVFRGRVNGDEYVGEISGPHEMPNMAFTAKRTSR